MGDIGTMTVAIKEDGQEQCRDVTAEFYSDFIAVNEDACAAGEFCVTHTPTGLAVARIPSVEAARGMATQIAYWERHGLLDAAIWRSEQSAVVADGFPKELREIIKEWPERICEDVAGASVYEVRRAAND